MNNRRTWLNKFDRVKKFIDQNKRIPTMKCDDDEEIMLGSWLNVQILNYKHNRCSMNNVYIYNKCNVPHGVVHDEQERKDEGTSRPTLTP